MVQLEPDLWFETRRLERHISVLEQRLAMSEICCSFGLCDVAKNKGVEEAQVELSQSTISRLTGDHIPLSKRGWSS